MKLVECTTCKGQGYISLPGFASKMRADLSACDETLVARAETLGVATLYKCEFCKGEGQILEEAG